MIPPQLGQRSGFLCSVRSCLMFGSSMSSPPPHSCAPASALDARLTSADPGPVVVRLLRLWRRGCVRALGLFLAELISTGDTPATGLMLSRPLGDLPRRDSRRHQGLPAAAARSPEVRDPRRPSLRDPQFASMAGSAESPAVVDHVAASVTLTTRLHRLGASRTSRRDARLIDTHDFPLGFRPLWRSCRGRVRVRRWSTCQKPSPQ